ncbi:hypothetical protein CC85DRAFT_117724 [Cutaneotrichosporon oleaginosum]|uniref:Uncharacterized protein n=1 Tax=Cutaneotrichosporon oleaginosum TaxID=879819 RepID=A0A0J0XXL5_9TREE|nr:uncharacterized protein CC85DRAFT_117724 [Cutaneotrichosporon oleaginosum]KLT45802.1 hypothetical protein CC85DRAFT_117724 [Cutaneotrichosporon oleaginosum]TXT04434.1 hypothetical protein COLE_07253 [Cutaneotrichosporon oleaginosum]
MRTGRTIVGSIRGVIGSTTPPHHHTTTPPPRRQPPSLRSLLFLPLPPQPPPSPAVTRHSATDRGMLRGCAVTRDARRKQRV